MNLQAPTPDAVFFHMNLFSQSPPALNWDNPQKEETRFSVYFCRAQKYVRLSSIPVWKVLFSLFWWGMDHIISLKWSPYTEMTLFQQEEPKGLSSAISGIRMEKWDMKLGVALRAFMAKCSLPTDLSLPWMRFCRFSGLEPLSERPLLHVHLYQPHRDPLLTAP